MQPGRAQPALTIRSTRAIERLKLVTRDQVGVVPGVGYGENGKGDVRIAMVENEQRLGRRRGT